MIHNIGGYYKNQYNIIKHKQFLIIYISILTDIFQPII